MKNNVDAARNYDAVIKSFFEALHEVISHPGTPPELRASWDGLNAAAYLIYAEGEAVAFVETRHFLGVPSQSIESVFCPKNDLPF